MNEKSRMTDKMNDMQSRLDQKEEELERIVHDSEGIKKAWDVKEKKHESEILALKRNVIISENDTSDDKVS